jgi:hypothetical protein
MKPFIIVCGVPKLGKTTEVFKTFQDSLAIMSSANNAHYYRKLLRTQLKEPVTRTVRGAPKTFTYKPPKRIKLVQPTSTNTPKDSPEYSWEALESATTKFASWQEGDDKVKRLIPDPNGNVEIPVSQVQTLEQTVLSVVAQSKKAKAKGEPLPYENIIIDEWGEFLDRIYAEILPTCVTKKGEINPLEAYKLTDEWMAKFINWLKELIPQGVGVCVVCHDREPGRSQKGELRPGGPKAPSAGMAYKMVGMSDGAIQRYMKDPEYGAKDENGKLLKPERLWRLSGTEEWNVGLRGILPEEEELCARKELYDILVEHADFDL